MYKCLQWKQKTRLNQVQFVVKLLVIAELNVDGLSSGCNFKH